MIKSFDKLLAILSDNTQPLPLARLPELSDLEPAQLDLFLGAWPEIDPSRRRTLLIELGQLADLHFEYSFESINRFALGDESADVRRIATDNLWECEDVSLASRYVTALQDDPEPRVRASSATALAAFVYMCEVSDYDVEMMRQIEDALSHSTINDPDTQVRLRSLEALGYSSRAEVPSLIQQAYDVGDEESKNAALLAMGRSANKDWSPIILTEFHNAAPHLRAQAAHAAGEIELQESLPELIDLLSDVKSDVRFAAIWSLGQIGGKLAIEALTELLETTDDADEAAFIDEAIDHAIFIDSTPALVTDDPDPDEEITT
jgi:HEAT repeat protein